MSISNRVNTINSNNVLNINNTIIYKKKIINLNSKKKHCIFKFRKNKIKNPNIDKNLIKENSFRNENDKDVNSANSSLHKTNNNNPTLIINNIRNSNLTVNVRENHKNKNNNNCKHDTKMSLNKNLIYKKYGTDKHKYISNIKKENLNIKKIYEPYEIKNNDFDEEYIKEVNEIIDKNKHKNLNERNHNQLNHIENLENLLELSDKDILEKLKNINDRNISYNQIIPIKNSNKYFDIYNIPKVKEFLNNNNYNLDISIPNYQKKFQKFINKDSLYLPEVNNLNYFNDNTFNKDSIIPCKNITSILNNNYKNYEKLTNYLH